MITFIFIILMLGVFGKLLVFALKAAWGLTKILLTLIFLPLILILMACTGLIYVAVVFLIIGGIVAFLSSLFA